VAEDSGLGQRHLDQRKKTLWSSEEISGWQGTGREARSSAGGCSEPFSLRGCECYFESTREKGIDMVIVRLLKDHPAEV
jgi:hypothetical protein